MRRARGANTGWQRGSPIKAVAPARCRDFYESCADLAATGETSGKRGELHLENGGLHGVETVVAAEHFPRVGLAGAVTANASDRVGERGIVRHACSRVSRCAERFAGEEAEGANVAERTR